MANRNKYSIIENDLIQKITDGFYHSDDKLPTEEELRKIYDCSRVTVRRALSDLNYMGYIYSIQGSGSFVSSKQKLQSPSKLSSLYKHFSNNDAEMKNDILKFEIRNADKNIASLLGIHSGAKVYYIERLRYVDRHPIIYEKKYLSVDLHPYISYASISKSIYFEAENHGLILDHEKCSVIPCFPDDKTSDYLQISNHEPILKVVTQSFLKDKTVFGYGEEFYNPNYYQFNFILESH